MVKAGKQEVNIAVMANDIKYIKDSLAGIQTQLASMDGVYVHRDEFNDYKVAMVENQKKTDDLVLFRAQVKTYGAAALILMGIIQFLISKFL